MNGCIMAGGRNSRMNYRVKALLEYEGATFLERIIAALGDADKFIVTNTPEVFRDTDLPMYPDLVKDIGPMGGVYTALKVSTHERCIMVGCDMPLINREIIEIIDSQKGYDVVVPRIDGRVEMLCAMYSKECIPVIERLIGEKKYKLSLILKEVRVKYIELPREKLQHFININSPEDYRKLSK
ncbi:putative molybdenum cofactor guanylyltransferase [Propionigenium maris DSM 9537]|uniref:Probable molybdenum cofactor guanylyltransferase n=1 Tax=Propionigenium maris DSM 9537 TaxID=1123000 RepID=A0A9W6LLF6_9FUSO|nr:molybdenum cofactor guanylyltransferase [Propionigenium maris]GLI54632.1 putative molybdenum cofactor guanylyltransferase [Propionigenium maris DSM 9537]